MSRTVIGHAIEEDLKYERRLWPEKDWVDRKNNSHTSLPPSLSRLRGYAQDAKNAKILFFYRIGTDDSIKQSALRAFPRMVTLSRLCSEGPDRKMGCFFESSVPIRKRLCGLRDLYVERKNKYIKKRGVWGVSPPTEKCS